MPVYAQEDYSRPKGSSGFTPGTASPNQSLLNQSLPIANPEIANPESRGRRVAALLQRTNTMTLRTFAKGVGMSVAAALALVLFWPGTANAQLSCANGEPPVTGLSGVPSCPDANTTAVMLDGSVYRQTAEIYATEGPIYEVDAVNQEVHVMGKVLKIPVVVNYGGLAGTTMNISGSSILGNDGEARSEMDAENIDRMQDVNAVGRDVAVDQTGAVRSVFGAGLSASLDPTTHATLAANYRNIVEACYPRHANFLPANFLELAIGADGNRYPSYAGGTFKTAGHRYELVSGDGPPTYLIPDIEVVLELSENVTEGTVTSAFPEDLALGCPPSLTIDDQLLIMNPDPRFGRDILGIVEQEIRQGLFTSTEGSIIAAIGHTVGEHVNFMQEVLTDLIDPNDVVHITTDRGQITETNTVDGTFGGDILSVRAIGAIDKPGAIEGFTRTPGAVDGSAGLTATVGALDADGNYVSLSVAPRPLAVIQAVAGREGTFTIRGRQDIEVRAGQGIFVSHLQVCGLVRADSGTPDAGETVCSEPGDLENSTAAAFDVLADEAAVAGGPPPAPAVDPAAAAAVAAADAARLADAAAAATAAAVTAAEQAAADQLAADAAAAQAAADQAAADATAAANAATAAAAAQAAADAAAAEQAAADAAANPTSAAPGTFDINLVPGEDPAFPNANFTGTSADVAALPTAGTNASRLTRPRFDFVVTDVPMGLFSGTGDSFGHTGAGLGEAIDLIGVATPPGQIGVGDEIGVDRFSLTFTDANGAIIRIFGGDNAQIVAQEITAGDGVTVTGARQDVAWVLFSIRDQGLAVDVTTPALVVGSSLATLRVDSDVIATWSLVGDSSTPEGALAVSISAGANNAGIAAPVEGAPAAEVVVPTPVATPEAQSDAQPEFSFQENANARGRLRVEFESPAGCNVAADTDGISCRSRDGRPTSCRGRNLQANQQVTFTCQ
jgi:hypothetical protein